LIDLTVTLQETDPAIWRRLLAPEDATLEDLHEAIQSVTGWWDYHLHEFAVGERLFGRPDYDDEIWDLDSGPSLESAWGITLGEIFREGHRLFEYRYDFGDGWRWSVSINRIHRAEEGETRFRCVDGARAAPLEDVGGISGYETLCEALADPRHEEHEEYVRWAPDGWNPEAFSVAGVDWILERRDESSVKDHVIGWMGGLPERLTITAPYYTRLFWALQAAWLDDAGKAAAEASRIIRDLSDRPMPVMDNLTPRRFTDLMAVLRDPLRDPLVVPSDLSEEEVRSIPALVQFRCMLDLLDRVGSIRLTKVRKEVPLKLMYHFTGLVSAEVETGRKYPPIVKRWMERHSYSALRILYHLRAAGLARLYKGAFRLTRRGAVLRAPEAWHELLTLLLRTELPLVVDFEHPDDWMDPLGLSLGYLLYRWAQLDGKWREAGDLLQELLPPYTRSRLLSGTGRDAAPGYLEKYYLTRLAAFGLAERRDSTRGENGVFSVHWRPTPLAGRLLQFQWSE
jgi:hypothetical protein